jgi:hypothetical protein
LAGGVRPEVAELEVNRGFAKVFLDVLSDHGVNCLGAGVDCGIVGLLVQQRLSNLFNTCRLSLRSQLLDSLSRNHIHQPIVHDVRLLPVLLLLNFHDPTDEVGQIGLKKGVDDVLL